MKMGSEAEEKTDYRLFKTNCGIITDQAQIERQNSTKLQTIDVIDEHNPFSDPTDISLKIKRLELAPSNHQPLDSSLVSMNKLNQKNYQFHYCNYGSNSGLIIISSGRRTFYCRVKQGLKSKWGRIRNLVEFVGAASLKNDTFFLLNNNGEIYKFDASQGTISFFQQIQKYVNTSQGANDDSSNIIYFNDLLFVKGALEINILQGNGEKMAGPEIPNNLQRNNRIVDFKISEDGAIIFASADNTLYYADPEHYWEVYETKFPNLPNFKNLLQKMEMNKEGSLLILTFLVPIGASNTCTSCYLITFDNQKFTFSNTDKIEFGEIPNSPEYQYNIFMYSYYDEMPVLFVISRSKNYENKIYLINIRDKFEVYSGKNLKKIFDLNLEEKLIVFNNQLHVKKNLPLSNVSTMLQNVTVVKFVPE